MSCVHFDRDQICKQVDASFSPFGHPTQVNATRCKQLKVIPCQSNKLATEMQDISSGFSRWVLFFSQLQCTCESVWPANASLYASPACDYMRPLAIPFGQGFNGDAGITLVIMFSTFMGCCRSSSLTPHLSG